VVHLLHRVHRLVVAPVEERVCIGNGVVEKHETLLMHIMNRI